MRKSVRQLDKCWWHISFSKNAIKVDVGKKINLLTGNEKAFYEDQRHARECRLSEVTDEEHVFEKQQQLEEK